MLSLAKLATEGGFLSPTSDLYNVFCTVLTPSKARQSLVGIFPVQAQSEKPVSLSSCHTEREQQHKGRDSPGKAGLWEWFPHGRWLE